MAKVKEINKMQPEPIRGLWWFNMKLDTGEEVLFSHADEAPYKVGDELPAYEIKEEKGRGGSKKVLRLRPETKEDKGVSVTVDSGEKRNVILSAKARACIDLVSTAVSMAEKSSGKAKTDAVYKGLVKMVWKQLDEI